MLKTPLYDLHHSYQARLTEFAGYELPLHYGSIIAEHLHTRARASVFDVSHMGQALISPGRLSPHVAVDLDGLAPGKQVYAQIFNEQGGIVDDLMLARDLLADSYIHIVVNAARQQQDFALLQPEQQLRDLALLALQGPLAVEACSRLLAAPELQQQRFMTQKIYQWYGQPLRITRSGYSGEDGVEIALPASAAPQLVEQLLQAGEVQLAGLGARDSLRIEAGLCLYGNDIDAHTTPVEAGLAWSLNKQRLQRGDFAGSAVINGQIQNGSERQRVGLLLDGKQAARAGSQVYYQDELVGSVTSGCYAPSIGQAVAMAYIHSQHAQIGRQFSLHQRGRSLSARQVKLPFYRHNYYKRPLHKTIP